jgi:asparagine N-glycosylation enzyme membrane subunit Stt3
MKISNKIPKNVYVFIPGIILLIFSHTLFFIQNYDAIVNKISIGDVDGYWHLLRVEKIHDGHDLHELSLSRSNAPYGEKLHWTKAFDILLLSGAYILSFLMPFEEALYWFGNFVNPLMHLITFFLIANISKTFFKVEDISLLSILLPFQLVTTRYFRMGNYDHHGFILLLFTIFLVTSLKAIQYEKAYVWSLLSGFIASICIWAGIESIFYVALLTAFMGLTWIIYDSNYCKNNLLMFSSMFVTSAVILIFELPIDKIFSIHFDRISFVHLFLWGLLLTFWLFVSMLKHTKHITNNISKRIVISCLGIFFCSIVMYTVFPKFFYGPEIGIDPLLKKIYMDHTTEFAPLFTKHETLFGYLNLSWLLGFLALLMCMYIIKHKQEKEKLLWSLIGLLLFAYGCISLYHARWLSYFQLLSIIPMTVILGKITTWETLRFKSSVRPIIIVATILSFCLAPFTISQVLGKSTKPPLLRQSKFLNQLCIFLNEAKIFDNKKYRILTSIYIGPLILYKTKHEVIGTPAHRNEKGILDTYKIMNSEDEEIARGIIQKRDIDFILVGPPEYGLYDYLIPEGKKEGKFYHRLWYGPLPDWLEQIPITTELNNKIKAFRINKHKKSMTSYAVKIESTK